MGGGGQKVKKINKYSALLSKKKIFNKDYRYFKVPYMLSAELGTSPLSFHT